MRTVTIALYFSLLCFSCSGLTANLHPHAAIVQQAHTWLEKQSEALGDEIQVKVNTPDSRLRFADCKVPLSVFIANGVVRPGPQTLGVRCPHGTPWTVYLSSYVQVFSEIAIASHALTRGHVITASDFDMKRTDVSRLKKDYLTQPKQQLGKITRRPIRKGQIMSTRLLTEKKLVRRGDTVQIVATSENFSIRMTGVALEPGRLGERIEVRNVQSKRIIEGQVTEAGVVRVSL